MAAKDFVSWVERQAQNMRRTLLLGPIDVLDPFELAKKYRVIVHTLDDFQSLPLGIINRLLVDDSDGWSGGAMPLPDGSHLVVMNPNHSMTRRRATLMEEIAHIHLKHQPSQLVPLVDGLVGRSYKKSYETEAYWVGAAALVPVTILKHAQSNGISITELAKTCGVSRALVGFRQNVTHIK